MAFSKFAGYSPNVRKRRDLYHIKGNTNIMRQKIDAIFISSANSLEHEQAKLRVCWLLKKAGHHFITEAERNRKKDEARVIVDIVDLNTGEEYEIESDKQRAKEFEGTPVNVIKIFEPGWENTLQEIINRARLCEYDPRMENVGG